MQRCVKRVVCLCLLLVSCADSAPAKAPTPIRPAKPAHASYLSQGRAEPASPPLSPQPMAPSPRPPASRETEEHLIERFATGRALAVQSGSASYYADSLAGRSTASGKPYDPRAYTAAHRNLPFGSVLRVTRLDGGQVVYVRVNDRGPYGSQGRILDLSRAAAERLAMLRAGVVKIKLEVLEYGPSKPRRASH